MRVLKSTGKPCGRDCPMASCSTTGCAILAWFYALCLHFAATVLQQRIATGSVGRLVQHAVLTGMLQAVHQKACSA